MTEAAVSGLTVGRTYYFAVRAVNVYGVNSPLSGEVAATIQPPAIAVPSASQLFWRNESTGVAARWYLDGANQVRGEAVGPGAVPLAWKLVGSGDFNRDGENDILWQHSNGQLSVWLMRGATLLSGFSLTPASIDPVWRVAAVADIDNDNNVDIVWQHRTQGYVAVWFMRGTTMRDGQFLTPGQVASLDWQIAGAGDFDADGHVDLLWRNSRTGDLAAWIMSGPRQLYGTALTPGRVADTDWNIVSIADMNSDGRSDIIWQHADGRLSVWLMAGTSLMTGIPLSPGQVTDLNWRVAAGR